jgi:prepilin signal peptidase PulO-like enzyme (type II secretory pathway)
LVTVGITGILGLVSGSPWWTYLLSFLLLFGALTTYWDFITGEDNFYLHGFGCGLAFAPFMWFDEPLALAVRIAVIAIGMGVWSAIVGKDWLEEMGRGFLLPSTLAIILFL